MTSIEQVTESEGNPSRGWSKWVCVPVDNSQLPLGRQIPSQLDGVG
jgi:hypothetical protein